MRNKINEAIARQYKESHTIPLTKDKLAEDSRLLEDIGFDSLDTMEVIAECENNFGIILSDKQLRGIKTVGDIYKIFEGR